MAQIWATAPLAGCSDISEAVEIQFHSSQPLTPTQSAGSVSTLAPVRPSQGRSRYSDPQSHDDPGVASSHLFTGVDY